jgi:putative endonuclease
MSYWVYILINDLSGKHYIGYTSDPKRRLREHNNKTVGRNRFTRKQKGTWNIIYKEEHASKTEAMKRERFLISGKGREWIKSNI